MEPSFRVLRMRGIPVGAHWTWPVAIGIVAWSLANGVFPSAYPGVGRGGHVAMAVAATGLLFASVVLHELAHAVTARREGMPVSGVTLWLLGGVSDVGGQPRSPGQEFRVAASGPVVSLVLAALFGAASTWVERRGGTEVVHGVLEYVARLNVVVAAFNLIPALPLDGGRLLRAWLWHRQRDLLAATRSGTRAGRAFGLTLVVVGVLNLVAGAGIMGVWLVVLGVFLLRAASSELGDARTRQRLVELTAADVMASDPGIVLNDTPVDRLVDHPPAPERSGYPVLGGGRLLGVVVLEAARTVPSAERAGRRVEDVMTPLDDVPMVDARDPVLHVLDRLNGGNDTGQVVVVDDGCVVGILDEADVAGALDRSRPESSDDTRSAGLRAWLLVGALCLVAGAALYQPPYVVLTPGPAVDVTGDVTITGVPVTDVNGRYVATTVSSRRASALGLLIAAVRDGHKVVGVDQADAGRGSAGLSRETRTLAAVAAARSQGLPTAATGTGARVVAVQGGSPAAGVLRPGDVVLTAGGTSVTLAAHLGGVVRSSPPGTVLALSVDRGGRGQVEERAVTVGDGGIGVTVETRDLAVELPFEVRFEGGGGGGQEAGLAYALAIADLLSPRDIAHGRTIAAAGTVDADSRVGPVPATVPTTGAAVAAHAEAALDTDASVFVVAADEVDGARRDGLTVEGVDSLIRALEALSTSV